MKLLLINPSRGNCVKSNFWDFDFHKRTFGLSSMIPLALPTIAALTPGDVQITVIDENIEEINFDDKINLVGIGAMTPNITRAFEIADEFRKREVKVAIGGIHASILPQEALEHADSVVIGEAEYIWKDLIHDFKNGNLRRVYRSTCHPHLEDSPPPRYDLVANNKYWKNQIQTTRGCPFDCEFCSVKAFLGKGFRYKKIEQVIEEINRLPSHFVISISGYELKLPKILFFSDDNIIGDKTYATKLFEALIPLNLSGWWCQATINVGRDKEILALMKDAGCRYIFIGLESLVEDSLKEMGKTVNKIEKYQENIETIQSLGINVVGSFILGNDAEDESIFEKTVNFIRDNNIICNMINILTPFPGTRLFKRLEVEGRIVHKDWKSYDVESVCFKPKRMSAKTLEEGRRWVCQQIYSLEAMQRRYENVLGKKNYKEVQAYETSVAEMSVIDKFFFGLLTLRVLLCVNVKQRKFLLGMLRRFCSGEESDLGTAISGVSFNDYAFRLPMDKANSTRHFE